MTTIGLNDYKYSIKFHGLRNSAISGPVGCVIGTTPGDITFYFQTEFTQTLTDQELRATIGHEVGHIINYNRLNDDKWNDWVKRHAYLAANSLGQDLSFVQKLIITASIITSALAGLALALLFAHDTVMAALFILLGGFSAVVIDLLFKSFYAQRYRITTSSPPI